jgi:hypothetical protein
VRLKQRTSNIFQSGGSPTSLKAPVPSAVLLLLLLQLLLLLLLLL